jgi:DNA-binding XRE family transcriptional regulator
MLLQAPSSPRALKELMYENLNFSLTTLATKVGLNRHTPRQAERS